MEKTIREWYEELPEPYRTKALANCEKQSPEGHEVLDSPSRSKSTAIATGFLWQDTPEHEDYWKEVYDTLEAHEADEFKENRREDWEWEAEQENKNKTEFED